MNKIKLKGAYIRIKLDHIIHNYMKISFWVEKDVIVTCIAKSAA